MRIRRPLAALLTALALFGGSATLTACQAAGDGAERGVTDDGQPDENQDEEREEEGGDLPSNSDPETGQNLDDDRQDPD